MIATKFAEELLLIATQTPPTHRAAQPYSSSSCSKWFLKRWKTSMWSSISNRRKINCSFCSSPIRAWPFPSWRNISVWATVKFAVWLHLWRRKTGFIARVPTRPDAGSCPESPDKRPHKCPYRNFRFFRDSSYAVTAFSLVLHLLAWHSCCLPVQWTYIEAHSNCPHFRGQFDTQLFRHQNNFIFRINEPIFHKNRSKSADFLSKYV